MKDHHFKEFVLFNIAALIETSNQSEIKIFFSFKFQQTLFMFKSNAYENIYNQ